MKMSYSARNKIIAASIPLFDGDECRKLYVFQNNFGVKCDPMTSELNQTIILSDGRALGYADLGDAQGRPVFLFHGQPGNRLFRHPDDSILSSSGIRLIIADRPGYGLSDYQHHRKLLDWPNDVVELADALGLDRFAVAGFSGGGPYAAACACKIPNRITMTGLVDSAPPMDAPEINREMPPPLRVNYFLARRAPSILKLVFALYWRHSRRKPEEFINLALKQSPPADREIISRPEMYAAMIEVWKENIRVDSRGYVQDVEILMNSWGFQLRDIATEIHLWQGEADANIPPTWARYMAKEIPNCKAMFFAKEGHFVLFARWKEIFQTLAGN